MDHHSAQELHEEFVAMDVDSVVSVMPGRNLQHLQQEAHVLLDEADVDMTAEYDQDAEEDLFLMLSLVFVVLGAAFGTMDRRSLRAAPSEWITVPSDFFYKLKAQRSPKSYRKTLRCTPDLFDMLCSFLEPRYYAKYGLPGKNTQYAFDFGVAVLLPYYGNGCGQDGDGIGGAAIQLGISRGVASRYI